MNTLEERPRTHDHRGRVYVLRLHRLEHRHAGGEAKQLCAHLPDLLFCGKVANVRFAREMVLDHSERRAPNPFAGGLH